MPKKDREFSRIKSRVNARANAGLKVRPGQTTLGRGNHGDRVALYARAMKISYEEAGRRVERQMQLLEASDLPHPTRYP